MAEKQETGEVSEQQLVLARNEGDAYRAALEAMIDSAHTGGMQEVQDVVIGFAQDVAKGVYVINAERDLNWQEPDDANCHLLVAVMDTADNRFIPYLDVQATFHDEDDTAYGPYDLPFTWHPGLYHYGRNVRLPGDGTYDIRIRVDAPSFERLDRTNGSRYIRPAAAVFENTTITTGQA